MSDLETIKSGLDSWRDDKRRKYGRFTLAALSSIPWVGGFLSASASFQAEQDQRRISDLQRQWLEEHSRKIKALGVALSEIVERLEELGEQADRRIEDPSYLGIVGEGFRIWDSAATQEKRDVVKHLLENSGGTTLCSDDVVRLFLSWIDSYHEIHFAVIREIHQAPGISRGKIWRNIYGQLEREDSAEADLYRLLIRDLSTGGVIRQHRETTYDGQFVKKRKRAGSSKTLKSAFDYEDPYVLTELGKQFVHYTMSELVPRIGENV
jgi:hypothetical protein